jgi:predicted nucleotidyltransferase component of viral defense system
MYYAKKKTQSALGIDIYDIYQEKDAIDTTEKSVKILEIFRENVTEEEIDKWIVDLQEQKKAIKDAK